MKNIFVSYTRDDLSIVEKDIIPMLKGIMGVDCWFDFECIETGADSFKDEIIKGIEESFIFIFVMSKNVMLKDWPFKEFHYAEQLKKEDKTSSRKVIWLKIDDAELSGHFAPYKGTFKDIISWSKPRELEKMKTDIRRWILEKAKSYYDEGKKLQESDSIEKQKLAFVPYLHSAEMGYSYAQAKVAYCFHLGRYGALKDRQKAIEWCEKSCNQDCPDGFSLMSRIYRDDKANYIQYLNQAANKGQKYSEYRLGKEYYSGVLKQDIISAIYWLKKAADQDQLDAQKLLSHILKKDFKHQETLAREYLQKADSNRNKMKNNSNS